MVFALSPDLKRTIHTIADATHSTMSQVAKEKLRA